MGAAALAIAQIRLAAGHADEAIEWAEKGRRALPDDLAARLMLIRALMSGHLLARAEQEATGAAERWPRVPMAQAQLGAVQLANQNAAGAQRSCEKAERARTRVVDRDPSNLDAFNLLGQLCVREGRLDAAREEFARLAQASPDPVGPSTMVAMILQAQNLAAEARSSYQEILGANPRAGVAANNLAWMYLEEGRLDEALRNAQIAKSNCPDSGSRRHARLDLLSAQPAARRSSRCRESAGQAG